MFHGPGIFVGVIGFFILSAFLLTYRLIIDYERAPDIRACLFKTAHYFIRRFFRIYLVFVLFWTIAFVFPKKLGQTMGVLPKSGNFTPYMDGIALYSTGRTHVCSLN
jgi:peptidoglycan/LPS O-acetylase OafA/YrhL